MNALKPWTAAIAGVLADGQPHALRELIAAGAAAVPPGVAHRTQEADRIRRRVNGRDRIRGDADTAIGAGANRVANRALHTLKRDGYTEPTADGTWIATTKLLERMP